MEEGVIYQVNCKDCEKIYIGETKFTMEKRIGQYKMDLKFGRTSNKAIARQVGEYNHQIDWEKAICLEKEKILNNKTRQIETAMFVCKLEIIFMFTKSCISISYCSTNIKFITSVTSQLVRDVFKK